MSRKPPRWAEFLHQQKSRIILCFWYKCSNLKMHFWSIKILISSFASVKCSIYREIWSGKINDTPLSVAFRDRISMQCRFIKNLPESVKAHTIKFEIAGLNNEHGVRMVSNIWYVATFDRFCVCGVQLLQCKGLLDYTYCNFWELQPHCNALHCLLDCCFCLFVERVFCIRSCTKLHCWVKI